MLKLLHGVHKFRSAEFGRYKTLFRKLSREGQNPHTLFITCSDSRVLAELITQSKPGDLFVVKNVGNIVPPAEVTGSTNSTAAAIEFAVQSLGVSDIVICGHSQCGAMAALVDGSLNASTQPHLAAWLSVASKPVQEVLEKSYGHLRGNRNELMTAAAQENVLFALDNLLSFPCVKERMDAGSLRLHGWFFEIASAELFAFDSDSKAFLPLVAAPEKSQPPGGEPQLF